MIAGISPVLSSHSTLYILVMIWMSNILSVWLSNQSWRHGPAKGRVVCEGWPPSSSLPFFHIPTHHKWRTAPLTSCLLARQSGSIIYTPLNCTVSYNSYMCSTGSSETQYKNISHRDNRLIAWNETFSSLVEDKGGEKNGNYTTIHTKNSEKVAQGCYLTGGKKMNIWVSRVTVPNCFKPHHDP